MARRWEEVSVIWHRAEPNRDGLLETLHPENGWGGILDRLASDPPTRLVYIETSPRRDEYGFPYIGLREVNDGGETYYEVRVRADTPSGTRYHTCETRAHAQEWAEGWFRKRFARAAHA